MAVFLHGSVILVETKHLEPNVFSLQCFTIFVDHGLMSLAIMKQCPNECGTVFSSIVKNFLCFSIKIQQQRNLSILSNILPGN